MPGMCSVPGCKGYKKARSRGVVFHSLPTRDPERCRKWLKAIHNPKFDENTPVNKYGNIRVCSQHFKAEDYEPDIQAQLMKTTPRKILKPNVVPSVFSGPQEELSRCVAASDRSRAQTKAPRLVAQASTSVSAVGSVLPWNSVLPSISSGTTSNVSQSHLPAELSESLFGVMSVDRLNESLHQETELSSAATSKSVESRGEKITQSKTIVNDSCLMELFKRCQTCGQPIAKKKVFHCGAQTKVRWSCLSGHKGVWMSSPCLWEAFPEIHLLTALSILFSGGTFTHFRKWARHLHLNFMDHKTFLAVQKTHISPKMKQKNRKVQEEISAKEIHQQPEGSLCHISDALKKIKSKTREKRALSSRSSEQHHQDEAEHQSDFTQVTHTASETTFPQDSVEEMEVTTDDDKRSETTDQRTAGPNGSDEDVYVPIIPQRSTASELLLECEEEELEPWQEKYSLLKVIVKDEVEDLANDQTECKPEPSPHQEDAVNNSPPDLKTETTQSVAFNNQGLSVASPQSTRSTDFNLKAQCLAGNFFPIVPAVQPQLFQKAAAAKAAPEPCDVVHTPKVHQISNNPVSLSSVLSPAVFASSSSSSSQHQADQNKSQILSVPFSLPCFTALELQSIGTSQNNE